MLLDNRVEALVSLPIDLAVKLKALQPFLLAGMAAIAAGTGYFLAHCFLT